MAQLPVPSAPALRWAPPRRACRRGYSPNLSILVGEGNESKRDGLSSGERKGWFPPRSREALWGGLRGHAGGSLGREAVR